MIHFAEQPRYSVTSVIILALLLCACASSRSGRVYSREHARTMHSVYFGTVLKVDEVAIEGRQTGFGAIAGGVLGGVAGNMVGGGTGRSAATAAGAVGGTIAGTALEKQATKNAGLELTVERDNGEIIVVVQEKDDDFRVGDRVRIVQAPDGTTRIRQ